MGSDGSILGRGFREVLSDKVPFEQRSGYSQGAGHVATCPRAFQADRMSISEYRCLAHAPQCI